MAYSQTVDERYRGGNSSYPADYFDAPPYRDDEFVIAEDEWAYGTVAYWSGRDVDVYSLGALGPGVYDIEVQNYTWDWDDPDDASVAGLRVLDSDGRTVASRSSAGRLTFEVGESTTVYAAVEGGSFDSAQYRVGYDWLGSLPANVTSSVSYTLYPSQRNLTLTGTADIDGTGHARNNDILGNSGRNDLSGRGGADLLAGRGDDDDLFGGWGDDTLDGGTGDDWMQGGAGDDVYFVDDADDFVIETAGRGSDVVLSSIRYRLPNQVEGLALTGRGDLTGIGNAAVNAITGNTGDNILLGLAGNDLVRSRVSYSLDANVEALTLTGSGATDGVGNALANTLRGNANSNVLIGAAGRDTLVGGADDDILIGGSGPDLLRGSAGLDSFVFRTPGEAGFGAARDRIGDFTLGEDWIDLADIDARTGIAGDQAFSFIGRAGFGGNGGELRYGGGVVAGDVNGDSRADFQIEVASAPFLIEDDFIL